MVTIKDIAQKAGVSTATVSNVIHGKVKKVSPATVDAIKKLIDEMGYVQPLGLSVMHKGNSQLLSVIINYHQSYKKNFLADPFYGMVLGSIEMELRRQGYYMMLHADNDINSIFKMATTWNVDGLIVVSMSDVGCEKLRKMTDKPIIAIDMYNVGKECKSTVPNIGLNDAKGCEMMIKHLLDKGYEDIYVCHTVNYGLDMIRWEGAKRAFNMSGMANQGRKLNKLTVGASEEIRRSVYAQIASRHPFKRKTAFFFIADSVALEAISYLKNQGIRIPEDIGIAGYDDDPSLSNIYAPGLTTIHQDFEEKGLVAAREIIKKLKEPEYEMRSINLPVSLIKRKSV